MTFVYQLYTIGKTKLTDKSNKIMSARVFSTSEIAEKYIPDFTRIVTTPRHVCDSNYLKEKNLKIIIGALMVVDE